MDRMNTLSLHAITLISPLAPWVQGDLSNFLHDSCCKISFLLPADGYAGSLCNPSLCRSNNDLHWMHLRMLWLRQDGDSTLCVPLVESLCKHLLVGAC